MKPCVAAHACNPSYLEGGRQEDHGSRPDPAKTLQDPVSTKKPGVVVHACDPSYVGSIDRKILV
jgi:hypothetical protein